MARHDVRLNLLQKAAQHIQAKLPKDIIRENKMEHLRVIRLRQKKQIRKHIIFELALLAIILVLLCK